MNLPSFCLDNSQITILHEPSDFEDVLVDMYKQARHRIVLAALYIGTGEAEKRVLNAIAEAYHEASYQDKENLNEAGSCFGSSSSSMENDRLQIDILIDSVRGQRVENFKGEEASSLSVLYPLLKLKKKSEAGLKLDTSSCNRSSHSSLLRRHKSSTISPLINVKLFHSPLLSGLLYRILPHRINEVLGVFHSKIFIADDTVILTGANLSTSYLTDRQDRYIVIKNCSEFASFLQRLTTQIQNYSFNVKLNSNPPTPQNSKFIYSIFHSVSRVQYIPVKQTSTEWYELTAPAVCPINDPKLFKRELSSSLSFFLAQEASQKTCGATSIHVAFQAGFLSPPIRQEEQLLHHILNNPPAEVTQKSKEIHDDELTNDERNQSVEFNREGLERVVLASGYLNMSMELLKALAAPLYGNKRKSLEIILASPEANSFHQSSGCSKYIPMAYSYVGASQLKTLQNFFNVPSDLEEETAQSLLQEESLAKTAKPSHPVFREYVRPAWTFHAKGLWLFSKQGVFATVIGSSNYGLRANCRDLDLSFLIQTKDTLIQQQLFQEIDAIKIHTRPIIHCRTLAFRCPLWIRLLLRWTSAKTLL